MRIGNREERGRGTGRRRKREVWGREKEGIKEEEVGRKKEGLEVRERRKRIGYRGNKRRDVRNKDKKNK